MNYPEEDVARRFHERLTRELGSTSTSVSIRGAGVNRSCRVERGEARCDVSIFARSALEFYTSFARGGGEESWLRVPSDDITIAAIRDWLDGKYLHELYERYPDLDREKRALTKLRNDVLRAVPEMQTGAKTELRHTGADSYELRFQTDTRSCRLRFLGKDKSPDARFSWDECEHFNFHLDDNQTLALVLRRWVGDGAMPSQMRIEFPWLEISKLADYYEQGRPIEGEFLESWIGIEEFFRNFGSRYASDINKQALSLIGEMRAAGYDHVLRAGQSMTSLGLSRSRRHGLRRDQPSLWFFFDKSETMTVEPTFAPKKLENHPIRLTADVKQLLDKLVEFAID